MTACLPVHGPHTTTPTALVAWLEMEAAHTARQRLARRCVPWLLHRHGIAAHEQGLILWLADTACATNADALRVWVCRQLDELGLGDDDRTTLLAELDRRLERLLTTLEVSSCQ